MAYRISRLVKDLDLRVMTGIYTDHDLFHGCCCDMLSWVMSRLDPETCWFTILNSMNVVAVAHLSECPCVILTENVQMSDSVLAKAREEHICICSSPDTTYEAAVKLAGFLSAAKGSANENIV